MITIEGPVMLYRLCRSPYAGDDTPTFVDITATDSPTFSRLGSAFAQADEQPTPGSYCPAIGLPPRQVLAWTPNGWWDVHLPTDGCHQYQRTVVALLAEILGSP